MKQILFVLAVSSLTFSILPRASAAGKCAAVYSTGARLEWDKDSHRPHEVKAQIEFEFHRLNNILSGSRVFKDLGQLKIVTEGNSPLYSDYSPLKHTLTLGTGVPPQFTGVVTAAFRHELLHHAYNSALIARNPQYRALIEEMKSTDALTAFNKMKGLRGQMGLLIRLQEVLSELGEDFFSGNGSTLFDYVQWYYSGRVSPEQAGEIRRFNMTEDIETLLRMWDDVSAPQSTSIHASFLPASVHIFRRLQSERAKGMTEAKERAFLERVFLALDRTFEQLQAMAPARSQMESAREWPFETTGPHALTPSQANRVLIENFDRYMNGR